MSGKVMEFGFVIDPVEEMLLEAARSKTALAAAAAAKKPDPKIDMDEEYELYAQEQDVADKAADTAPLAGGAAPAPVAAVGVVLDAMGEPVQIKNVVVVSIGNCVRIAYVLSIQPGGDVFVQPLKKSGGGNIWCKFGARRHFPPNQIVKVNLPAGNRIIV